MSHLDTTFVFGSGTWRRDWEFGSQWHINNTLLKGFVTMVDQSEQHPFIQERLEALHEIDSKLVSILNHSSSVLNNLINLKKNASNTDALGQIKKDFSDDTENFYKDLELAAINLKKEIKILDDRIGKTDSNGIAILPININKKATWAGREKLQQQLENIDDLLKE